MPRAINDNCNNCGMCEAVCFDDCITHSDIYRIDITKCTDCLNCVDVCSAKAIVEYVKPEEPIEEEPELNC